MDQKGNASIKEKEDEKVDDTASKEDSKTSVGDGQTVKKEKRELPVPKVHENEHSPIGWTPIDFSEDEEGEGGGPVLVTRRAKRTTTYRAHSKMAVLAELANPPPPLPLKARGGRPAKAKQRASAKKVRKIYASLTKEADPEDDEEEEEVPDEEDETTSSSDETDEDLEDEPPRRSRARPQPSRPRQGFPNRGGYGGGGGGGGGGRQQMQQQQRTHVPQHHGSARGAGAPQHHGFPGGAPGGLTAAQQQQQALLRQQQQMQACQFRLSCPPHKTYAYVSPAESVEDILVPILEHQANDAIDSSVFARQVYHLPIRRTYRPLLYLVVQRLVRCSSELPDFLLHTQFEVLAPEISPTPLPFLLVGTELHSYVGLLRKQRQLWLPPAAAFSDTP
eukprot:gene1788-33208_t